MSRRAFPMTVLVILALVVPLAPAVDDNQQAVVNSFRQYIKNYMQSYAGHVKLFKTDGGWAKADVGWEPDYKIDLTATNSLLSPYAGVCEFTLVHRWTAFHATKDEADKDDNFIHSTSAKHRHRYAFQDGRWVPTLRQHYDSFLNKWFNCDECNVKTDQPLGDLDGCWEPDTPHPVTTCQEQKSSGEY